MSAGKVVIFLDVDGVLVPVSPMSFGGGDIEPVCVQRFKEMIDACGGKSNVTIVISSTWRHDAAKIARLNAAFDSHGSGGIPHAVLGVPDGTANPTVVTYLKKDPAEQKLVRDRVDEIYEWMRVNKEAYPEAHDGQRWFAVDDMNLGVDTRMKGHFVKTDTEEGILSSDVVAAKQVIAELPLFTAPSAPAAPPSPPLAPAAAQKEQQDTTETATDGFVFGTVKRYNPNRGFGFLQSDAGEDVFVHQSMIKHHGFRGLNVGEPVRFRINVDPQHFRRQAVDVEQLSPYVPTNIQRQMAYQMRDYFMGYIAPQDQHMHQQFIAAPGRFHPNRGAPFPNRRHVDPNATAVAPLPEPESVSTTEVENEQVSHNEVSEASQHAPRRQYLGPGIPGRDFAAMQTLPLIPDGYGYRAANGTVFYNGAPTPLPPPPGGVPPAGVIGPAAHHHHHKHHKYHTKR